MLKAIIETDLPGRGQALVELGPIIVDPQTEQHINNALLRTEIQLECIGKPTDGVHFIKAIKIDHQHVFLLDKIDGQVVDSLLINKRLEVLPSTLDDQELDLVSSRKRSLSSLRNQIENEISC